MNPDVYSDRTVAVPLNEAGVIGDSFQLQTVAWNTTSKVGERERARLLERQPTPARQWPDIRGRGASKTADGNLLRPLCDRRPTRCQVDGDYSIAESFITNTQSAQRQRRRSSSLCQRRSPQNAPNALLFEIRIRIAEALWCPFDVDWALLQACDQKILTWRPGPEETTVSGLRKSPRTATRSTVGSTMLRLDLRIVSKSLTRPTNGFADDRRFECDYDPTARGPTATTADPFAIYCRIVKQDQTSHGDVWP